MLRWYIGNGFRADAPGEISMCREARDDRRLSGFAAKLCCFSCRVRGQFNGS